MTQICSSKINSGPNIWTIKTSTCNCMTLLPQDVMQDLALNLNQTSCVIQSNVSREKMMKRFRDILVCSTIVGFSEREKQPPIKKLPRSLQGMKSEKAMVPDIVLDQVTEKRPQRGKGFQSNYLVVLVFCYQRFDKKTQPMKHTL